MIRKEITLKNFLSLLFTIFLSLLTTHEVSAQPLSQTIPTHRKDAQFLMTKTKPADTQAQLYSVVSGKKNLIDTVYVRRSLNCMDGCGDIKKLEIVDHFQPVLAPDGETVFYSDLTACGFEGDGSVLYTSNLQGKNKRVLLASCSFLHPLFFFKEKEEWYVALEESNSGMGVEGSWIFNLKTRQPIVHVRGTLSQSSGGQLKFCEVNQGELCKTPKPVNTAELLERKPPLPYLPRYPISATVQKAGASWVPHESSATCSTTEDKEKAQKLPAGTTVFVLHKCDDGNAEIWHGKNHGTIATSALEGFKVK